MTGRVAATLAEAQDWRELALDWPLDEASVVVEVGGYEGRWAAEIAARYRPRLYVFEPQEWAFEVCRALLGEHGRVFNFGLGDRDTTLRPMVSFHTDGASFVERPAQGRQSAGAVGYGHLREVGRVFSELGLDAIDLLAVNCEGCEFTLLPHLAENGWLGRVKYLLMQYHRVGPYTDADVAGLRKIISITHRLLWEGPFAAWERK